jgi:hypothetical protein
MRRKVIRRKKYRGSHWLFLCSLLFVIGIMMLQITPTVAAINLDKGGWEEVRVEKGDTLWGIAEQYRQPRQDVRLLIAKIQEVNNLQPSEPIYPGQILLIPIN